MNTNASATQAPQAGKWRRRLVTAGAVLFMLVLGYLVGGGLARTFAAL